MPLVIGTRLGPYEILGLLGAGGMGEVYRARDSRLGREVAIKVLPEHLARDPQALTRFEREARAVAALSHPNILALYDIGTEGDVTYVVTELLEGETLRKRLGGGALPWRKAVEIAVAIAEGLSAAHAKGIVHRDLKPENIFLTSSGQVKILDFGLARWRPCSPQDESSAPTETEAGRVLGTVGYMSPEQVQGKDVDARSDIFSLGCVIYEMLTGRRAFAGRSDLETLSAILKEEPAPLEGAGKQIPAELEQLIARCLEKNPHQRLQSARDLALVLRDAASRSGTRGRFRNRLVWIAAGMAVVLFAIVLYFFLRPGPIDSLAVLPFVNAGANPDAEYLSDGITESIIGALSRTPRLRVVPRSMVFRYKGRDTDPQKIGRDLKARAVLTGRVIERNGILIVTTELVDVSAASQIWGERYTRKLADVLTLQEEISKEISAKLRLRLSGAEEKQVAKRYTGNTEAYQSYLKGRFYWNKRTPQGYKRATQEFQQAIEKDPSYALAYAGLADCYNVAGYYGWLSPQESFGKASAAAQRALAIDEEVAAAHAALAFAKVYLDWDWPGADKELRRAIDLDPNYPTGRQWRGVYYRVQGRLRDAMAETRRALELDPLSSAFYSTAALELYLDRQYELAIELNRRALEMDASYPAAHLQLGMAYEQKGMYTPAIAELQKAVTLFEGEPIARAVLGHAYAASGDERAARQVLDDLRTLKRQRYVSAYLVALVHLGLGEKEQAWTWLEQGYEERSSWLTDRVKMDPMLDDLRPDPRFADLLRRMHLGSKE